jgi:aminoglycoside 2'-N-acetyltransferase I
MQLQVLRTHELPAADLAALRPLLDAAFHGRFSDDDWGHALGGVHVVAHAGRELVAHAAVVDRCLHVDGRPFRTGYLEAVAAAPARQGEGFGDAVAREATRIVREHHQLGGLSTAHHRFYERLGWERWRGPTHVRESEGLLRTEDEDDGVMVLRFGPSAAADLAAPISCEPRPGDDW